MPRVSLPRSAIALLAGVLLVGVIVGWQSTMALLVLLLDGVPALAVLGAAALGGLWGVAALGCGRWPLRWQLLLGAALGTGSLSLIVLVLGLLGWLVSWVWLVLLGVVGVAGLARLAKVLRARSPSDERVSEGPRWLWLALCPFLALAILEASLPPGLLWAEEGMGYDVLEYHLQLPREYFDAGRIHYVPHNVYANFPSNAEMLYLLAMVLKGDPVQAAAMAQMMNLAFAGLVVGAAWLIGREGSRAGGVITGVVAGTTGWLTYLSGIAYVENLMLFFGLMALAVLVRAAKSAREAEHPDRSGFTRAAAIAGLLAGLSSGCKYPAVVLIALPLIVVVAGMPVRSVRQHLAALVAYGLGACATFLPWAVKNAVMTGDPVFPLASHWLGSDPPGWGPAEAEHFWCSHAPGPDERAFGSRLVRLWLSVPGDPQQRTGPLLIGLAAAGLIHRRRDRVAVLCGAMLGLQVLLWLSATHLYARFAVPLLIPLLVLVSCGAYRSTTRLARFMWVGAVVLGATWNLFFAARLYARHVYVGESRLSIEGVPEVLVEGRLRGYEWLGAVNRDTPPDAKVLLIGEARAFYVRRRVDYCVVFNRNPLADVVRSGASAADVVQWLRDRGYTHVLVNWREIDRLRRSRYGFPEEITPDLFASLIAAGLDPVRPITDAFDGRPYAMLYRLGPAPR